MSSQNADDPETHAPMLTWVDIDSLVLADGAPCVSIYVPTTPVSNYREANRIRYKDEVEKVHSALKQRDMDKRLRAEMIDNLKSVGTTEVFWTHQQYGLAVFLSDQRFLVRRMMHSPEQAMAVVADSFHLRPALRETSSWMRYQVLCVSLEDVALFDCNHEQVREVMLHSAVPRGMQNVAGLNAPHNDPDSGSRKRYFEAVDQAIQKHHNARTGLPLVLAAVAEHQGLFREVSSNANLLAEGLAKEPFAEIRQQRLGASAYAIAARALQARSDRWVERFRERRARGEGESRPDKAAYAATIGQIELLLVAEDARIEGTIDADSGTVIRGRAEDSVTDDVLDNMAEYVLRFEGDVRIIPTDKMPTDTGMAAVLRYAMQPETT